MTDQPITCRDCRHWTPDGAWTTNSLDEEERQPGLCFFGCANYLWVKRAGETCQHAERRED